MDVEKLTGLFDADFYTGVPDSQLRPLCDWLCDTFGTDPAHHIIAANEGNCTALAAGYYLATGKIPVVYLQNSGEGNVINPLASLLDKRVYAIPMIFVIGWRGEPGVHDEPQHLWQGEVTLRLLETMEVPYQVIGPETADEEAEAAMERFREDLSKGKAVAFVIRKNALTYGRKTVYANPWRLNREEVIRRVLAVTGDDPVVCTTGKASRELFELREQKGQSHENDFLTVGSMGHSSSIALGIALQKPDLRVWCIDGDGAMLMHMGALAVIGSVKPRNLIHIVLNNGAHETVGGMPNVMRGLNAAEIADACGYARTLIVEDEASLEEALKQIVRDERRLTMLEIRCALGARKDLGRPTVSPLENRNAFMKHLALQKTNDGV